MKGNILQTGRPFWLRGGEGLEAGLGGREENPWELLLGARREAGAPGQLQL